MASLLGTGGGVGKKMKSRSRGGTADNHYTVITHLGSGPRCAGTSVYKGCREKGGSCGVDWGNRGRHGWPSSSPQIACSALIRNFHLYDLLQQSEGLSTHFHTFRKALTMLR